VSLRGSRALWILIGIGTVGRIVWAFATYGHAFDLESCLLVHDALGEDPLHVYSNVFFDEGGADLFRWPYPPLFFVWIEVSSALDGVLGMPFHGLIQLPAILADGVIALLVYAFLRHRGAGERLCLLAAGLVALGPPFAVVSGYHGQIDALAILPAVAALVVWELDPSHRAVRAGLLIGIGAALKTVPLLMLVALLPAARDRREALRLVVPAVAVPALMLAPFLAADPDGVLRILEYNGAPGVGGLSLLLQPSLAADWLTGAQLDPSAATLWLSDRGGLITVITLAAAFAFLLRYRPSPLDGALFVWLVVYAFSPNLFLHYSVWALPFLLLAGYVRIALAVELWLAVPFAIVYWQVWDSRDIALVYAPLVIGLWVLSLAGVLLLGSRIARGRDRHPDGVQPPLVSFEASAPAPTRTAPDTA
jgi:hypothetical protein